jgi:protein SCO1/2
VKDVSVHDEDGLNGTVLPRAYTVPHIALESTSGKPYDLATDTTKPLTLVFFGYSNCPDVCQVVMAGIASALTRLRPAERAKVAMVFVTTDPRRDTRTRLRAYLDRFNPTFEGLTGDIRTIVRLGKDLDVPIARGEKLATGGYDVAHGTQIIGLRPNATAPFLWTQGTTPGALADDIGTILDDPGKVAAR